MIADNEYAFKGAQLLSQIVGSRRGHVGPAMSALEIPCARFILYNTKSLVLD
jgi:hypothetical protein